MREWRQSSIRQLVGAPISGKRPAGGVNAEAEGIPSLGGENIRADGGMDYKTINKIPAAFFRSMPKGRLQRNDVLINKDGAQTGKVGIYDGRFSEAAVNEHVFILRSSSGAIDQRLLYYYLLLPETQARIARRITGSAQPGLNSHFADAVHLTVPSDLGEQRRIVEVLSTVDEAIKKTEALITKTQQIKAGLMQDLFTRGVTADGQIRPAREEAPQLYKATRLGWIPKEWEAKAIGDVSLIRYGVNSAIDPTLAEGVPTITLPCVSPDGTLTLDPNLMVWTPRNLAPKELLLENEDLLFNWRNGSANHLGKTAYYTGDGDVTHVGFLLRVRPKKDLVNPRYLWEQLRFQKSIGVFLRSKQQVNNTFNSAELRNLQIPIAPPEEQKSVAAWLEVVHAKIACEREQVAHLHQVRDGLMQALLTGCAHIPVDSDPTVAELVANV